MMYMLLEHVAEKPVILAQACFTKVGFSHGQVVVFGCKASPLGADFLQHVSLRCPCCFGLWLQSHLVYNLSKIGCSL